MDGNWGVLGFPTMNVKPQDGKILPRYGVYACQVLIDGTWYGGVGNAGVKPTVMQEQRDCLKFTFMIMQEMHMGSTLRSVPGI